MGWVDTILTGGFVLIGMLMTFFILLQEGKGGGLAALGGTKAAGVEGVTNPIRRATGYLAGLFFILAIILGILHKPKESLGLGVEAPAAEIVPAAGAGNGPALNAKPGDAPKTDAKPADAAKTDAKPTDAAKPAEAKKDEKPADSAKPAEAPKTEAPKPAEAPKADAKPADAPKPAEEPKKADEKK